MDGLRPINVGLSPNDGTGDPPRVAFSKINANVLVLAAAIEAAAAGIAGRAQAGENNDITALLNLPAILKAARASLPRTEPTTPGTPWINGGVLCFTADPSDDQ